MSKTQSKKEIFSLSVCLLQTVNIQNNFGSRTKFSYFKEKASTAYGTTIEQIVNTTFICYFGW